MMFILSELGVRSSSIYSFVHDLDFEFWCLLFFSYMFSSDCSYISPSIPIMSFSEELVSIIISGISVCQGDTFLNSPCMISNRLLFGSPKKMGLCLSPEFVKLIAIGIGLQGEIGLWNQLFLPVVFASYFLSSQAWNLKYLESGS